MYSHRLTNEITAGQRKNKVKQINPTRCIKVKYSKYPSSKSNLQYGLTPLVNQCICARRL